MKPLFALLLFFFVIQNQLAHGVERWEACDFILPAKTDLADPFSVHLSAVFEHESGIKQESPGFYNGSKDFVVRFCPPESGSWKMVTQSSLDELDGIEKTVDVAPTVNRKGGIKVDPASDRRFRYQNAERYFPIAFEADWLFALDAENASGIPKTKTFVDQLARSGFNQIVMNVFAFDVNWAKDPSLVSEFEYGSPIVFPFGGDNTHPDYSTLNTQYFQRLDRVIEYLDEKGIAAHLMIYVWNKKVAWPEAGSEADNRYFDYVAKRYQAYPNLIWDISKEALGYGHTDVNYISERIKRLRELDKYGRLITVHDYGYCRRFIDNVDFVSVQLWVSELYSVMRRVCSEMPGKPILNIEHGGYERGPYVVFNGNYTSPEVCLERAYQCVFAGTFPTHYWQGSAWNVVIPDFASLPEAQRPKLEYYRHMHDLIARYELAEFKAGDKKGNAGFCLHNNEDRLVYYVPKECDFIGLRLPKERQGSKMQYTWFNPFTGQYSDPKSETIQQWPAVQTPGGDQFWILIVELESQRLDGRQ
ncbi:MAG: DUF4038 domain-containing protein [Aureliella sp.]